MGYDVHITRATHWLESEADPITLNEWNDYLLYDPAMRRDDVATAYRDQVPIISYENEGLAVWLAYSKNETEGNLAWFDYREGEIVVKNPDDEILEKMKQIAARLNARVIGDDGEEY